MKNIVIFGAPGSGKGTQSELLIQKYGFKHISTGDVLRAEIAAGTELGKTAQGFIDHGQLIPDSLMIEILAHKYDELCPCEGLIFDGFPRTVAQAEALDAMGIEIDRVVDIEVSDEKIAARMSGRRVCQKCGATYHVTDHPSKAGDMCDKCGGELAIRSDDAPEVVHSRLEVYHTTTEPLYDYYVSQGNLVRVDGLGSVEETIARTFRALGVE